MFFDMLTVPEALGIKKYEGAKRLQASAYRFWLTGLLASAMAGLYSTYKLRERTKAIDEKDAEGKVEGVKIARRVAPLSTSLGLLLISLDNKRSSMSNSFRIFAI